MSYNLKKQIVGWILAIGTGVAIGLWLPIDPAARQCFGIVLAGIVCMIFHLLPNYIVGLWIIIFPVILGLTPSEIALKATTQWSWWIFLTGFIIGIAFDKTGLGERFGLYFCVTLVKGWFSVIGAIFLMNVFFNVLAPFSGAAAIAIGISIFLPIADDMGFKPGSKGFNGIALACVTSNLLAGELVLTGWTLNPLAVNLFAPAMEINFFSWIRYFTLPAALFLLISYIAIVLLFKPEAVILYDPKIAMERLKSTPRISWNEKRTLILTFLILLSFITQPLHRLEAGWLAVGISLMFFIPTLGVLDEKDFTTRLPWSFVIFLLGIFSIGYQLSYHNVHKLLAEVTMPVGIETWSPVVAAVFISGVMTLMHFLVGSMVPLLASFIPTLTSYAMDHNMSLIMIFGAVLFSAKRWVFPFQEAFVLMTRGLTGGLLENRAVIQLGIVLTLLVTAIVIPASTFYWHLIAAP